MNLQLVPLDCPTCGSAMRGDPWDVLFFCSHCGAAALLGSDGLEPVVSTALLPAPGRLARVWHPAWVLDARVEVRDRTVAGGGRPTGWTDRRRFVIPAFELSLSDRVRLARGLTTAAPEAGEVPREPVRGGTLRLDDAQVVAQHLVVGDEVRRPDMLSSLTVSIDVERHRLAAIPFESLDDRLRCAVTGIEVRMVGD
jgi:hypothetical protein